MEGGRGEGRIKVKWRRIFGSLSWQRREGKKGERGGREGWKDLVPRHIPEASSYSSLLLGGLGPPMARSLAKSPMKAALFGRPSLGTKYLEEGGRERREGRREGRSSCQSSCEKKHLKGQQEEKRGHREGGGARERRVAIMCPCRTYLSPVKSGKGLTCIKPLSPIETSCLVGEIERKYVCE